MPLTIFAAAHADDASVGGDGHVFAMGGAGLALPYAGGDRMNLASLAYEKKAFGLAVPSGSFINDGISADKISKALTDNSASAAVICFAIMPRVTERSEPMSAFPCA